MRNDFHGFYRPTTQEFDSIWRNAIIAVDANVLLNLYTYSRSTADEILALLGRFSDRIWLPYQVAAEYHRNRCGIILKEAKRYAEILKPLQEVGIALRTGKRHPYVSSDLVEQFDDIADKITTSLKTGETQHRELIATDPICDKLTELFNGRVGEPMNEATLEQIYKDGAKRFARKIPPGYGDLKKSEPSRYGDLVLWQQLIEHAAASEKPIIFVTDDLKEDWWAFAGDKRVGPRPELRHEFRSKTGREIYIYSTDAFVDAATERGTKLSEKAANEIELASSERQQDAMKNRSVAVGMRDSAELYMDHLNAYERAVLDGAEVSPDHQEAIELAVLERAMRSQEHQEAVERAMRYRAILSQNHQEAIERAIRTPTERYMEHQEAIERAIRPPTERFMEHQEAIERAMRTPTEQYMDHQEAVERANLTPTELYKYEQNALDEFAPGFDERDKNAADE